MTKRILGLLLLLGIGLSPLLAQDTSTRSEGRNGPAIGVLLFRTSNPVSVACVTDSRMMHLETVTSQRFLRSVENIEFDGAVATVGDERIGRAFRIRVIDRSGEKARGSDATLRMGGKVYEGVLDFFPPREKETRWLVVNRLPMERYLCGVLDGEMADDFPLEALKAQAVASRTYALFHMKRKGPKARYHLKADTSSQVYSGIEHQPHIAKAVHATRGKILIYDGRLFETFYHSTCGGATVSAAGILGGAAIEPLESSQCGFCKDSKFFRWQTTVPHMQVESALKRVIRGHEHGGRPLRLGRIESIRPVDPGPGGHATYLRVKHSRGSLEVDAHRFRLALINQGFSKLRSSSFACQPVKKGWLFKGRGWGHGAGMCQMGATGLANDRETFASILGRYYRGARATEAW